ncbi:hypothetical protein N7462_008313 [Penicillium macrosclerotiorum]|uniref:uncharacterized protein n=1 Tax=Penicillium macrosclerotiorum TaxID=303699 RepID=UPI002547C25E|nr:uncharacterized protein N7462_008313 [Penicillium macrosclerotiorum]KAJ5675416.1 hypothetical protein N7462_008313 [Penicillium macrosclerotiorum]
MRVEKESESPDSEGASHQKQDPLERRRLQNRLSQRNHRRKIRDRIAKLQERVIANELRAAAALNGWDQPFPTSPLISNRRMAQPDPGLGMSAQDPRQFAADPSPALVSSYGLSMVPSWSGHLQTLPPQTQIPEESSYLSTRGTVSAESICSTSNLTGPNLMTSRGFEVCSSTHDGQMISQMSNNGTTAPFEPFTTGLVNQPLYYVTTGEFILLVTRYIWILE